MSEGKEREARLDWVLLGLKKTPWGVSQGYIELL